MFEKIFSLKKQEILSLLLETNAYWESFSNYKAVLFKFVLFTKSRFL